MRHGMLRLWQILRFVVFLFFLFQSGVVVLIVEVWCGFAHESSSRTTWYSLSSSCREWLFEIFDDHSFNNNPLMLVNSEDDPDSVTCATRFQMKLMRKYGEPLPRLFIGSFDEAINKAKRDFKFLLVYLHSDIHENTPRFCRSLITISLSCFTSFCFFFESHWKIFCVCSEMSVLFLGKSYVQNVSLLLLMNISLSGQAMYKLLKDSKWVLWLIFERNDDHSISRISLSLFLISDSWLHIVTCLIDQ